MPWSLAADGFYDYTPSVNGTAGATKTTKIYYVTSSGDGGDNSTGTANDSTKPYATIGGATGVLSDIITDRGSTGNSPDWILVKRGQTIADDLWDSDGGGIFPWISGHSSSHPLLIASYDPSITATSSWGTYHVPNPASSALTRPTLSYSSASCVMQVQGASDYGSWKGPTGMALVGLIFSSSSARIFLNFLNPTRWFRIEDCKISGFGSGVPKGAGFFYHRCVVVDNHGQGIDIGGWPASVYSDATNNPDGYTGGVVECVVDSNPDSADGLIHNLYLNGDLDPFLGVDSGGHYIYGNIFSRDLSSSQFRSGGVINNNSFIGNALSCVIGSTGNRSNTVNDNVFIHGISTAVENAGGITTMQRHYYVSNQMNQGSMTYDNNIFCHETDASGWAIYTYSGARALTYSNNLFYKWCEAAGNSALISGESNRTGSVVEIGVITPGSGYTDKTIDISDITWTDDGGSVLIVTITMASHTIWPWLGPPDLHNREGYIYIDGITAGGTNNAIGNALNGAVYRVYYGQSGADTVQLQGTYTALRGLTYGTNGTGGKLYIPYLGRNFTGGGTNYFRGDVLVANGEVVDVRFGTDADDSVVSMPVASRGDSYSVNDSLSLRTGGTNDADGIPIGTIPGGSGFSFLVSAIHSETDGGGNTKDATGSGSYPDATRTVGTYYDYLTSGSGSTYGDFCDACLAQTRNNWNDLLMAESLNDYIRQGFGVAMLGSAYADTQAVNFPPIFSGPLGFRLFA